MCTKIICILVSYVIFADGKPAYDTMVDQSQTGDLNVDIHLKNVQIIAVLGGREQYTDYDYNYDYAEMTIKPPNKTSTASPLNATSENSTVASDLADNTSPETTTRLVEITPKDPPALSTVQETVTTPSTTERLTVAITSESSATIFDNSSTTLGTQLVANQTLNPTTIAPVDTVENCRKGFHRNKKGECELKLKPSSNNALLKLVELSQKLKLRRANKVEENSRRK